MTDTPSRLLPFLLLGLAAVAPAQLSEEEVTGFRRDLEFIADELPKRHANAFALRSKETFEAEVARIREALPSMDRLRAAVALSRLVASLGDSHTRLDHKALLEGGTAPLGIYWWKDGIRVYGAPKPHAGIVGLEVATVGGVPVDEAVRRIQSVEAVENRMLLRWVAPNRLVLPRLLKGLGLGESEDAVHLGLRGADGGLVEARIEVGGWGPGAVVRQPDRTPRTARRRDLWHYGTVFEDPRILYIQYNRCATSKEHDLTAFVKWAAAALEDEEKPIEAVVFDLRFNGGGNSVLGDMMFARLSKTGPLKRRERVFCLIGRRTFSSAILNAMSLKRRFGATFIGEPTGGSPNHFGEVKRVELPWSRSPLSYSTKVFVRAAPGTTTIEPDHLIEPSWADYCAGRELLLDKVVELMK